VIVVLVFYHNVFYPKMVKLTHYPEHFKSVTWYNQ